MRPSPEVVTEGPTLEVPYVPIAVVAEEWRRTQREAQHGEESRRQLDPKVAT